MIERRSTISALTPSERESEKFTKLGANGGKAAADAMQRRGTPVDAAILGIVDRVDCDEDLVRA